MGTTYWNRLASSWASQVFRVRGNDQSRAVIAALQTLAARGDVAHIVDFGCGIGDYLPTLSRLFDHITAYDSARECARRAEGAASRYSNVKVHRSRASLLKLRATADAVLCVNVLIDPSRQERQKALHLVRTLLRPGGHLLLVVPSFESASLLAEVTDGTFHGTRYHEQRRSSYGVGVLLLGGGPTKHFTQEELTVLVSRAGFRDVRVDRVPYSWKSHGLAPPRGVPDCPWDWLVMARSRAGARKSSRRPSGVRALPDTPRSRRHRQLSQR